MSKIPDASAKKDHLVVGEPPHSPLRRVVSAIVSSLIAFAFWPVTWTIFWYVFVYLPKPEPGDNFALTEFEKLDGYRYVLGWLFWVSLVVGVLVFLWKLAIMSAPTDESSGSITQIRAPESHR
jgi:hypothetical protein